jgi:hypothetical protein
MIVVATASASNFAEVGVTRLLSDGSFDTTFGTGGTTQMPPGYPEFTRDLAIQPDGAIVLAAIDGSFELARFLPAAPQIGSFTASPNPVTAGSSLTLTAGNIQDANPNATITQVAFYQDSNGDGVLESGTDSFVGYGVQTSPGVWTLTFSTAGLTGGTYTLFAQAEDSYGVFSTPLPFTVVVP